MARGDIHIISFPATQTGNEGREQTGRRPAVVLETDLATHILSTLMVAPFSSQLGALRFPHTLRIDPSPSNGLSSPSVLLLFQLRAIDKRRIQTKIGQLGDDEMKQVDEILRKMLGI